MITGRGRGAVLVLLAAALAFAGAVSARAASPVNDACQPDPLDPGLQVLRCRYGPIEVTPAGNLILAGPVTIEAPRADGYLVSFRPDMVDAVTGEIPPIHEVHLHHGVWLTSRAVQIPFAATGEEKTVSTLPDGYGYRVRPTDQWVLNYMLHNLTAANQVVSITYEIGWINASSPLAADIEEVMPLWLDTVGGLYPVYDPDDVDGVVYDAALGKDVHRRVETFSIGSGTTPAPTTAGSFELVWMAGHVHPGGHRIDVEVDRCQADETDRLIFSSDAQLNQRAIGGSAFGSWDFLMTATDPDWRVTLHPGDRLRTKTYYDITHPWYEAMGIVFGWVNPLDAGEAPAAPPCLQTGDTSGTPTREMPASAIYGGTTELYDDPATVPADGAPVSRIDILGYDYRPGGVGQPPAPVAAGATVTFTNWDAAASIFHTVTPCADRPCNRETGQSYPLPSWDFFPGLLGGEDAEADSKQLGYGPPGATSASNRSQWQLRVPATAQPGDTFTYFCRVHPYMRGSIQVVS